MTTSATPARRLVLVPSAAPRGASAPDARLRRYRIARVALAGPRPRAEGFEPIRRIYD